MKPLVTQTVRTIERNLPLDTFHSTKQIMEVFCAAESIQGLDYPALLITRDSG